MTQDPSQQTLLIKAILKFDPNLQSQSLKPLYQNLKSQKFPFLTESELNETVELIRRRRGDGFSAFNGTADDIQFNIVNGAKNNANAQSTQSSAAQKAADAPRKVNMNDLYVSRLLMKKQKQKMLKKLQKEANEEMGDVEQDEDWQQAQQNANSLERSLEKSNSGAPDTSTANDAHQLLPDNDASSQEEDEEDLIPDLNAKTVSSFTNIQLNAQSKKRKRALLDGNIDEQEIQQVTKKALIQSRQGDSQKQCDSPYLVMEKPTERYADFGGVDHVLAEIKRLIEYPFRYPDILKALGSEPARGVLLYGPPGCGKTMLAQAIAGELGKDVSFFRVAAPEIVSGMSGESEQKLRQLFEDAQTMAPSLIYIDEIDTITPKRETASRGMEKRIVAQLLSCMDSLNFLKTGKLVMVLASTNVPDSIDTALRRAGRFEREITLGIPDEEARWQIVTRLAKSLKLSGDFDFRTIAKLTPGYVGADLHAITKEAATNAISRIYSLIEEREDQLMMDNDSMGSISMKGKEGNPVQEERPKLKNLTEFTDSMSITMEDFQVAVKKVQPSAKREGFATVPDVSWDDVGALGEIRHELQRSITDPIDHPQELSILGLKAPCGVLLYGPPGCGKTLVAKAIANQSKSNFISVKGPELLNKFVGESERAVRTVFERARASSPCIIFFDELDALCPKRGMDRSNAASERVVNQLLTELDGVGERKQVFVIAATNRPDIIDPAMLRPGRLDKMLYVPIPDLKSRVSILKTVTRKTPLARDVNLATIAKKCENFSGADLSALAREASTNCFEEYLTKYRESKQRDVDEHKEITIHQDDLIVHAKHFQAALVNTSPSVGVEDRHLYEQMRKKINEQRTKGK